MNRVRGGLRNASHTPKPMTPARPTEVVALPESPESSESLESLAAPEPRRGGWVAAPASDALASPPIAPEPDLPPPVDRREPPVPVAIPIPVVPAAPLAPPALLPVAPVVAPVTAAPAPAALPPGDDLMPARVTASRRARRRAQRRNRWMIGGAASLAGVLALAGIAWAVAGDNGSAPAAKTQAPTKVRTAPDRSRTSTTTAAPDASSTTTTTVPAGAAGATAGAAAGVAAAGPVASAAPDGRALDAVADITQTGCRYDADAGELVGTGTVHNPGDDALIEIDVTFSDATGELDSASDIQQVAPGETLDWEASTLAFDPPTGTLTCQVSQS